MVEWSLSIARSCLSVLISVCKLFVYSASLSPETSWLCAQSSNWSVIGMSSGCHWFSVHSARKCCSDPKWSIKLCFLQRWTLSCFDFKMVRDHFVHQDKSVTVSCTFLLDYIKLVWLRACDCGSYCPATSIWVHISVSCMHILCS